MVWRASIPALGQRTLVMGVLNVTPDSFSDGGQNATRSAALDHGARLAREGADLIDVGGESTKPGAEAVDLTVEIDRVVPVIEGLVAAGIGPISIDTTKAEVAERALRAGARIINDVSGGTFDPEILGVAARHRAPIVLMHTRARPSAMQQGTWSYEGGVVHAVTERLRALVEAAERAGIEPDAIAVDPGIGFGKTLDENLELLADLDRLAALEKPILVGTSRKGFIGKLTGREVGARAFGTAATVALAIDRGAAMVRVHDVAEMIDVCRVADAIVQRRRR